MTSQQPLNPGIVTREYTLFTLLFVYACITYAIIGFSWGALMGGIPAFRMFVDTAPHGKLILLAHGHINLLGWVEMAIFGAIYYFVPRLVNRPIYSMSLVKIHFWMHNVGLMGMVVLFTTAGFIGGYDPGPEVEATVNHLMAGVGFFGTLVLLANIIWGYNIFKTGKRGSDTP
ncbi:MAG: cbb3-type cytochrome c oxidase subunit I [Betaproteobacteria bacterium]|nr:cbb3-type cytochrome c oxidase subunit I [Betaproteobacteria bacterium]MDE2622061.1 cbb3-type cytochrome c oxidase subunit I [Betaproteobacteria bacterium]